MKNLFALTVLILAGCVRVAPSVEDSATNNPEVRVELLFAHDGCRVYRFEDVGRYRYFANCPSQDTITGEWSETCGKNCTHTVSDSSTTVYGQ